MDGWEFYPMFDVCIAALVCCTSQSPEKNVSARKGRTIQVYDPWIRSTQIFIEILFRLGTVENYIFESILKWTIKSSFPLGFIIHILDNYQTFTISHCAKLMMRDDVSLFLCDFLQEYMLVLFAFVIPVPSFSLLLWGFHLGCSTLARWFYGQINTCWVRCW